MVFSTIEKKVNMKKLKIEQSDIYGLFKSMDGNRSVSKGHVESLKRSFVDYPELIAAQPVLVNEDLEIIDGQHRFEAAKELKLPINYIKVKGLGVDEARKLNVTQRKWIPMDYASSYAGSGSEDYATYIQLREEYEIPHNVLLAAISRNRANNAGRMFKLGEFHIDDMAGSVERLQKLRQVQQLTRLPLISPLCYALLQVMEMETFDWERFIKKLETTNGAQFLRYSQIKDYLRAIEDTYNYGVVNKTRLF